MGLIQAHDNIDIGLPGRPLAKRFFRKTPCQLAPGMRAHERELFQATRLSPKPIRIHKLVCSTP